MIKFIAMLVSGAAAFGSFWIAASTVINLTSKLISDEKGAYFSSGNEPMAFMVGITLGLVVFTVVYKLIAGLRWLKEPPRAPEVFAEAITAIQDAKQNIEASIAERESHLYAIAEDEMLSGAMDKGLWAKALVLAKGDEVARKAEFLKLRVKQLKRENTAQQ